MRNNFIKPVENIDYRAITNTKPIKAGVDTVKLFNASKTIGSVSPIDEFITNNNEINKIWINLVDLSPELASLVLLGYMSAVESYMRALFRGLIHIDISTRKHVDSSQISFAAAMNHERMNMPDALLEDTTFVGSENIKKSVTKFLNLSKEFAGMDKHFEEFEKICQLRHCCTHRFGKLGAKNAAVLGMSAHNKFLEKPLNFTCDTLEESAEILRTFVKSFNNDIFGKVMQRTVVEQLNLSIPIANKVSWTWSYVSDKTTFEKYYKLFASRTDAIKSKSCKTTYERFVAALKPASRPIAPTTAAPAAAVPQNAHPGGPREIDVTEPTVPKVPQVEVKASASALPAMDGEKATASEKN